MNKHQWYRNTDWTQKIQEEFEARLAKSRSDYNKAQYLRIQGYYLQSSPDPDIRKVGRDFYLRVISEFPEQDSQVSEALIGLAQSYENENDVANAEKYYRDSIDYDKELRQKNERIIQSYLLLPELIIKNKRSDQYEEALDMLTRWNGIKIMPFHDIQYRYCLAIARLATRLGFKQEAVFYASKALELNEIGKTPQLSGRPTIGIVQTTQTEIRELQAILEEK